MKKLAGLVVILAVLILGGYYSMGVITERTVRRDIDVINQSNGLNAKVRQYNRGLFTSTAVLDWRLHVPERIVRSASGPSQTVPAQDYQLDMPITIHHGPIIIVNNTVKFGLGYARTDLQLPEKYSEQFKAFFTPESTQPKLDLSLFINYFNNSTVNINVPSFKMIAKQPNGELHWLGMRSSMSISSHHDKIDGNVVINGLRFVKDQMITTMSKLTTQYNLHQSNQGLFLGGVDLSFPSLVVKNNDQMILELQNFDVNSSSDVAEGLFNSHLTTSLAKISANNQTYGPGNLEMAVRNLDADVLARINAQANKMQQGTDFERQQAMLAILPELPKLFSKGAEFEISQLHLTMPQGTIEGNTMISLPKGETANPFAMIQKIQGHGKLKAPTQVVRELMSESYKQKLSQQPPIQQPASTDNQQPVVVTPVDAAQQALMQTDQQLAAMVSSGFLTLQGSDYVIEVSLDKGQLMVNGKAFSPTMLQIHQ